jgi:hypothetical protein
MAHPAAPALPDDARAMARQLAGAWILGSALMGTVALLFLNAGNMVARQPSANVVIPGCPLPARGFGCPSPSLFALTPVERLAVFALVSALFVSLGLLGWRTAAASWLTGDPRARLLWTVLVGTGGLVGWGYAAVVTFAAGFSPATQILLAYLAGGLPFALVAGMLLRPWRANVAALGISTGLLAAGFVMVAGHSPAYLGNVFTVYADYARSFFSTPPAVTF